MLNSNSVFSFPSLKNIHVVEDTYPVLPMTMNAKIFLKKFEDCSDNLGQLQKIFLQNFILVLEELNIQQVEPENNKNIIEIVKSDDFNKFSNICYELVKANLLQFVTKIGFARTKRHFGRESEVFYISYPDQISQEIEKKIKRVVYNQTNIFVKLNYF
jgi:hypothetical protein